MQPEVPPQPLLHAASLPEDGLRNCHTCFSRGSERASDSRGSSNLRP
jgi:hypothetical protein